MHRAINEYGEVTKGRAVKTLPEGYLRQLVGHSKDMDTYEIYSHRMADDMSDTALMVQEVPRSIFA